MTRETVEYRGHIIEAETTSVGGSWAWSFTINGQHYNESKERVLRGEQAMRREAIDTAKSQIDRLLAR